MCTASSAKLLGHVPLKSASNAGNRTPLRIKGLVQDQIQQGRRPCGIWSWRRPCLHPRWSLTPSPSMHIQLGVQSVANQGAQDVKTMLATCGKLVSEFGRKWPSLAKYWLMSSKLDQDSSVFQQVWSKLDQVWQTTTKTWPKLGKLIGQIWSKFAQFGQLRA